MKLAMRMAVMAGGILVGGTALAVDLTNDDARDYDLKIITGPGATKNSKIYRNSLQRGICSSCEIQVLGVGSVKVSGPITVVIKGGKLSTRR